ncbi:unnamed protein product [Candida verbasci]|uniref:Phosphatidic acid phosphatase type 2/haloperoxidase domain-containing protein n=1 Tax=Candida verbasci TaxID=1227364 RepID=A0A9W4XIN9_9ASCO|nr:unnamed protein product [Candida verbasci]
MSLAGLRKQLDNFKIDRITIGIKSKQFIKWRISDLFLIIILIIIFFTVPNFKPFHRLFYLDDKRIQYPFAEHETVTTFQLFLYSTWIPLIIINIFSILFTSLNYKIYLSYIISLGLLLSVILTSVVTDILKNFFGRHRPDFLARCLPKEGTPTDVLVSIDVCTQTDSGILEDGFRTTPSGHSSISFAGGVFLTLFLIGQLQSLNTKVGTLRFIICFIPTFCACLIALSRTEDYRHNFIDIFVGSLIGITIATYNYFKLFPKLTDSKSYCTKIMIEEMKDDSKQNIENELEYTRLENV